MQPFFYFNTMKKIVLTGGPCGGKTTALTTIVQHFTALGYKVFTIPEVPTIFIQSGMDYLTTNRAFFYQGEKSTMEIQMALENAFIKMAETITDCPTLLVCDRGLLDITVYMGNEIWKQISEDLGVTREQLLGRYDGVLHLVTAADGAEAYYTTANNAQRLEKADEEGLATARSLDQRTLKAWSDHPQHFVIGNEGDFQNKLNRVIELITKMTGD